MGALLQTVPNTVAAVLAVFGVLLPLVSMNLLMFFATLKTGLTFY